MVTSECTKREINFGRLGRHANLTAALFAALSTAASVQSAAGQLRVVAWNISNYDGLDRSLDVQTAIYASFDGRSMSPDVILAQEFLSVSALTTFRNVLNSASGSPGDWVAAPFVDGADTESVCLYRSSRVVLVGGVTWTIAVGSSLASNQPRNTYRYDLRPVGYNAGSTVVSMYNVHMKAGSGTEDNARRLVESTRIRDNAEGLDTNGAGSGKPAAYQFLVGGDMNMQRATWTSYEQLVLSQTNNTGRFFDPINTSGSWNNNSSFRFVHTQDPVGPGGMDDRHDQILVGAGLIDGAGLDYIGNASLAYSTTTWNDPNHSYRVWGNDGSSFDVSLTTTGNTMVGPAIATALRNAASASGGHLPVFLDLRVPAKVARPASINFGAVAQNATAQQSVSIGNGGDIALWTAAGIANVTYTIAASSGFTAPGGSFSDAAGGLLNSHTITMNTSTPGIKTGTLTVASNDPDSPSAVITITGTVLAANTPPLANAGTDITTTDLDGSGAETVTLNGSGSSDPDGTIILYRWTLGANQLVSGTSPTANVALPVGTSDVLLTVTDNGNATATDIVRVIVNPRPNQPPTANAGSDITVEDSDGSGGESVLLDGSGSTDSDGSIAMYTWREGATVLAESPLSIASIPLNVGQHTLTLTVTDDDNATAVDTVVVEVNQRPNQAPFANAGADQGLVDLDRSGEETFTLDGAASTDLDGTIVSYIWMEGFTQVATGVAPIISLPVGDHTITLTVTDNGGAMATDDVMIAISSPCVGDFNQDGGIDGADVEAFFASWTVGDPSADVNVDGGVDGADVEVFFVRWAASEC